MAHHSLRSLAFPSLMTATALALAGCSFNAQVGSKPAAPPPPPPAQAAKPEPQPAPAPKPAPVVEAAPKKSAVTVKDGRLGIPGNIVFEFNKATLLPESEPTLNALKEYMEQNKNFRIRIEGHTDNVGSAASNLKLSQDRAMSVVGWLEQHGIHRDRCLAVGFGDTKPVANNATKEGQAENRRTEFHIAEVSGKPFMGRDPSGGGEVAAGQTPPAAKK